MWFFLVVALLLIIVALCVHFGKRDKARKRADVPALSNKAKAEIDEQDQLTARFYQTGVNLDEVTAPYLAAGYRYTELKTRVFIGGDLFETQGKGYYVSPGMLQRSICYRDLDSIGNYQVTVFQESPTEFVVRTTSPRGGARAVYPDLQGAINYANSIDTDHGPYHGSTDGEVVSKNDDNYVVVKFENRDATSFSIRSHGIEVVQLVYSHDNHSEADLEHIEDDITGAVHQWYLNEDDKDFVYDLINIVRASTPQVEGDLVIRKAIPDGIKLLKSQKKIKREEALKPSAIRAGVLIQARKEAVDDATISVVEAARMILRREEDFLIAIEAGNSDAKEIYRRSMELGSRHVWS